MKNLMLLVFIIWCAIGAILLLPVYCVFLWLALAADELSNRGGVVGIVKRLMEKI